jgi:TRAP-type C4-dicarboxylate transport system permease small subunit
MEKLVKKITNVAVIVLSAVAVIAGFMVAIKGNGATKGLDASFSIIYILLCIALLLIVLFAVMQIVSSKKQIVRTLILLAACVVIVLISYFIAPTELSDVAVKVGVSQSIYKWIGTALNVAYIVFAGVVIAFLGSLVYIKIKNR